MGDDDEAREAESSRIGPDEARILGAGGGTARRRETAAIAFGLAFVVMTCRSERRRSGEARRGRGGA